MTQIFNEQTKIIGADAVDGKLPVKTDPTDRLTVEELLEKMLLELKKITLHLSLMTGENIKEADLL
jgi:hypothetical protein